MDRQSSNLHESRREYILAVGTAGLAAIAGCTSDNSSEESTPADESTTDDVNDGDTDTPQDVSNGEDAANSEPNFEVVSLQITDEMELGETASLKLQVRNSGNAEGNFTKRGQITSEALDYSKYADAGFDIGGVIEPGETETFSQEIAGDNLGSFRLSIEDYDVEADTSVVARDLSLGEDYTNVKGVKMSIDEIVVQDSYEDEEGNDVRPDNGKFVIVKYSGENTGDDTVNPSSARNLHVRTGEESYDHSLKGDTAANYDKLGFNRELEPGETLQGYQFFDVNRSAERQDLTVTWDEVIGVTEKRVNWNP
ncbi:DUF4352 domain-containing protein [Haloarcula laminariae]|uniref:DUF4352 domain-containing protein n=1 Tax=Haloarcula laminariae TaxID=2961577 RepID=UPI00240676AB|nr:DUF4352 domain-containing protein [Halomicroarcula sp. FL173]